MENFLSNLLNRHRGQIASVKPRPVHRYEDNFPEGHATAEGQSPNKAGWVRAGLDWEKTSRQSSLTRGYQDEKEAVGVSQSPIHQVSPRVSAPIKLSQAGSQPAAIDNSLESEIKSDTYAYYTSASRANNSLALRNSIKKKSTLPSAEIESSVLSDTPSDAPNQLPAPNRSADSSPPKEMRHLFPKPSVTPEDRLIGSNVPAKVQPTSAKERQVMDSLNKNVSMLRELDPFGSQKIESAGSNTPVRRSPSKQEVAPAVHVTIGRIEIRATSPPQATAGRDRPPKSSPLLSLNDYLNRRSGKNQ
jgi:hypothetical protein